MIAWLSIALGLLTALAIAADVKRNPQHMAIMNITWPVTGLYFPIVGWWLYKSIGLKGHGEKPLWQGVFVSTTHCGGGCTLGDTVAAPLTTLFGVTVFGSALLGHFAGEFVGAYLFGILFQFLPIMSMGDGNWRSALGDAIKADTLSLVAFEIGMFGWMAIASVLWLGMEPRPDTPQFWFMMQIGMILGLATAYPANWWLVQRGVKHAM
ncbi:DUF4396 domain-containing protein [Marinobacter halodurans]|uniref:DUF4396 domain-containing protein n=2 Tax=Marinobacter halodurans TaxID=2528979 RepID=A0ABY1ZKJ5_9GAMM|nr:DUF4396 domain-containing protein [Marinobacter halodurans]